MDAATLRSASAAGKAVAVACGLRVDDLELLSNSNRLALLLRPCELLARVVPLAGRSGAEFEVRVARLLEGSGAPVAGLDPRVEPLVYEHDGFAVTLWTCYQPTPPQQLVAGEYADALARLHAGMRQTASTGDWVPHFMDRVNEARRLVDNPANRPDIASDDRKLLATTLATTSQAIASRGPFEQLLHGEPHSGNVLRSQQGLVFVDLETCCWGPVEFDIAHATMPTPGPPLAVAALYPSADTALVEECWKLMLAMIAAWRFDPGDSFPDGNARAKEWISQLRAGLQG